LKDNLGATSPTVSLNIQITKPHPLHNTLNRYDVTGSFSFPPDGLITAGDVLAGINYINAKGSGPIPLNTPPGPPYPDVNADNVVAADDILEIINWINSHPAETESPTDLVVSSNVPSTTDVHFSAALPATSADLINMLAADVAPALFKRRRLAN
jgi:hypothetical protein